MKAVNSCVNQHANSYCCHGSGNSVRASELEGFRKEIKQGNAKNRPRTKAEQPVKLVPPTQGKTVRHTTW